MNHYRTALELLPTELRTGLEERKNVEELRLRVGQPVGIISGGRHYTIGQTCVSENDLCRIMEKASSASLHTACNQLANGYISFRGLRIGICGSAISEEGGIKGFSDYRSLNIRIPASFTGELAGVWDKLTNSGFKNILIAAPPGGGKTTALRELIRGLSERGYTIAVIDDRDELFPQGVDGSSFDCGRNTDVLSGTDKYNGAMLLLRSMNPQVIAMDEISREGDAQAIMEIYGCGAGILATAHGENLEDMYRRDMYRKLFDAGIFYYILEIGMNAARRSFRLRKIL